jgi:ABC-type transporter Mla subunit MlaD
VGRAYFSRVRAGVMKLADFLFLGKIEKKLDKIYQLEKKIMAKVDDLNAALEEANTTTNEIADDLTALMAQLSSGLTAEQADAVITKATALSTRLKAVAAQYPPSAPPV